MRAARVSQRHPVLVTARALLTGSGVGATEYIDADVRVEECRPDGDAVEATRSFLWRGVGRKPS